VEFSEYLQKTKSTFKEIIKQRWDGKDIQETLFRNFVFLKLIPVFDKYTICDGNFSSGTIQPNTDLSIFMKRNIKDKGDVSDLTLLNDKTIVACTSKNPEEGSIDVTKLDIDRIENIFKKVYEPHGFKLLICFVVPDKQKLISAANRAEKTSILLANVIRNPSTIIIEHMDLEMAYNRFQKSYGTFSREQFLKTSKKPLILKFHQEVQVYDTFEKLKTHNSILWGQIPRSGKSYTMGGLIDLCNFNNVLIITTSPNETINQYKELFETHFNFESHKVFHLQSAKKIVLSSKNIIICSKQFLQFKMIIWLSKMKFNIRFVDEGHNGGTTELAQSTLNLYGSNAPTIYMTATGLKVINTYGIPEEAQIFWDYEDINLCKKNPSSPRLVEKHGSSWIHIKQKYSDEKIKETYSLYPEMVFRSLKLTNESENKFIEACRETDGYGFSIDSLLIMEEKRFKKEKAVVDFIKFIFGKNNAPVDNGIIPELEHLRNQNDLRIVLAFLPVGNIEILQETLKKLIEDKDLLPHYLIVCINSKINQGVSATEVIKNAEKEAKNQNKKNILVLSGRMLSLGISIQKCDIVLMLNNIESMDSYYQMIFRCMTEDVGKKYGFVIDLNIHRVAAAFHDYAMKIKNKKPKEGIQYILEQRLISIQVYNSHFVLCNKSPSKMCEELYEIYYSRPSLIIREIFQTFSNKAKILSSEDQKMLNSIFYTNASKSTIKKIINEITGKTEVQKGVVKKTLEKTKSEMKEEEEKEEKEKDVNPIEDVINPLTIILCLLTIHDENSTTFVEMCEWIKTSGEEKEILFSKLKEWWGKESMGHIKFIDYFIKLFEKSVKYPKEFDEATIRLKDLFVKNVRNQEKLCDIIYQYLIPKESEKNQNAEVSTPYKLSQQMLETLPPSFWKTSKRVFDPCVGKGRFIVDVLAKFMEGLKQVYPDEKLRYKNIVENCLFWSDINPFNIWIGRLLLDPLNEYNLKYFQGSTLDLDINRQWKLKGFDLIIGNPPYQKPRGDKGNKGGKSLWPLFVDFSLDRLNRNGYLIFVHPALWREPKNDIGVKMFGNKFHIISIHGIRDGMKTFRAGTRYDWYVLQKTDKPIETTIIEEDGNVYKTVIDETSFIPNFGKDIFDKLQPEIEKVGFLEAKQSSVLSTSTKNVQTSKDKNHPYILINTINSKETTFRYSSKEHPLQKLQKVIFSEGGMYPFYDKGEYGITQSGIYILVSSKEEGDRLVEFLKCDLVKYLVNSAKWGNFRTSKHVFTKIPKPTNIQEITNEKVFDYFKFTPEQISKVRS
jgi:hypothetical protein